MGNRIAPSRSFNTVTNSNRKARAKKRYYQRLTLLGMCLVAILLTLTLVVFGIFAIAHAFDKDKDDTPKDPSTNNPLPAAEIVYEKITKAKTDIYQGELIVVNEKDNLKYSYPSISLKPIADVIQKQNGEFPYVTWYLQEEKIEASAAEAANRMLTDFYLKFNDSSLIFLDAYRTTEQQQGKQTPVGFSEHETGYVFTLQTMNRDTNKNAALTSNLNYNWIYQNCSKYGIIARYPDEKTAITGISGYGHCFRYVGVAHATYIMEKGLCLEEYVALLKNSYPADQNLKINGADGNRYEVYYVPAGAEELTTLQVPKNYEYTVSGDNISGFIVTVNLDKPIA